MTLWNLVTMTINVIILKLIYLTVINLKNNTVHVLKNYYVFDYTFVQLIITTKY